MHLLRAAHGHSDTRSCALHLYPYQGHRVHGVYMRNWDAADEGTSSSSTPTCTSDREWLDVQRVCAHLKIPCERVDFVRDYWTRVFADTVESYRRGMTPNPDVACNREIKFGVMLRRFMSHLTVAGEKTLTRGVRVVGGTSSDSKAVHLNVSERSKNSRDTQISRPFGDDPVDGIATGHYARIVEHPTIGTQLHRGIDPLKDQSFFLATVPRANALSHCLFPVGHLHKRDVRETAVRIGLPWLLDRQETAGICFVGRRRKFQEFLREYVDENPGPFVVIESGRRIEDEHPQQRNRVAASQQRETMLHGGMHSHTIGQRACLPGLHLRYHVVTKDSATNVLFVTANPTHPGFFSRQCTVELRDEEFGTFMDQATSAVIRYRDVDVPCHVSINDDRGDDHRSALVQFDRPVRALAPGQTIAFYRGSWCIGAAMVTHVPTLDPAIEHGRMDLMRSDVRRK